MAATMLSPYTLLSRAPAPVSSAPGKLPAATALQLRKPPPPAVATSAVALPWSRSRRASLFMCHVDAAGNSAADREFDYGDLQPNVLEIGSTLFAFEATPAGRLEASRKPSTLLAGEKWSMMGDRDVIILKLWVGDPPPEEKVGEWVSTTQDQAVLLIKYKGGLGDKHPARLLDKSLVMPRGYDANRVKLKRFGEWLLLIIAKPRHDPQKIDGE